MNESIIFYEFNELTSCFMSLRLCETYSTFMGMRKIANCNFAVDAGICLCSFKSRQSSHTTTQLSYKTRQASSKQRQISLDKFHIQLGTVHVKLGTYT